MALSAPVNGVGTGSAPGQSLEWDGTIWVPRMSAGSSWPAVAYAGKKHFRTDRDIEYLRNASGVWVPQVSAGAVTLYVDGTNGTDDSDHGFGSGNDAFASIVYAVGAIPGSLSGDCDMNIASGTYNENVVLRGKDVKGDYKIRLKGTLSDVSGASGTATSATHNGSAPMWGTMTTSLNRTLDQDKGKLLVVTGGTGYSSTEEWKNEYIIYGNTAGPNTVYTIVGRWYSTPDGTTTFQARDWATDIAGGSSEAVKVTGGQKAVELWNLKTSRSSGAQSVLVEMGSEASLISCSDPGTSSGGGFKYDASLGSLWSCYSRSGFRCFILGSNSTVYLNASWGENTGSSAARSALFIPNGGIVITGTTGGAFTGGGSSAAAIHNLHGVVSTGGFLLCDGSAGDGVKVAEGGKFEHWGTGSRTLISNNGGWGVRCESGGAATTVQGCVYSGNTLGTYTPSTLPAGGTS